MPQYNHRFERHPETGWQVVHLECVSDDPSETTMAMFTPEAGCNLLSFQVGGTDYMCDLDRDKEPPAILGTPILYPMPNRVRDARFSFEGRAFTFTPNNGTHFIHGLVRDVPWMCDEPIVSEDGIAVTARITFEPGSERYRLFPIRNSLELTYTLKPRSLTLAFRVRNQDARWRLPFGLAIHPYFRIIGPRESIRLQVPAKKWMESIEQMPTGRLIDLAGGPVDLCKPRSLSGLDLDDVYWGADPDRQQIIYYDQIGKKVTLTASNFFTHCVVYTPAGKPFFCIENQSCSTDAHNLYARGLEEAAHLTILDPGESLTASVVIAVGEQ
jgi:aldose 1-epimerase